MLRAGSANNAVVEDGGVAGFCDLTSDYGSNRQAVVTQVAVSIPTDAMADIPGSNLPRDINLPKEPNFLKACYLRNVFGLLQQRFYLLMPRLL